MVAKGTLSRKEFLGLGVVAGAGLMLSGCGDTSGSGNELAIAYQPGIGYAQLLIMKEEGWLEKDLPGVKVSWKMLSSGSAIREGMLAGDIHVGSGGMGPFLIGFDSGIGWKILSPLNDMDVWLMAKDEGLQSLDDFGENDKIALPAPDSAQAVILKKGAQEQLGNASALDTNISSLEHPAGLQALMSGQVAGHLTSPPFQFQEQDRGARAILKSYDLFGRHTFNNVFIREEYHDQNPEIASALWSNIQRATDLLQKDSARSAEILSRESGGEMSPREFERFLTEQGVGYTTLPNGYMKFAGFMEEVGMIQTAPGSWKDLVYDNLKSADGS